MKIFIDNKFIPKDEYQHFINQFSDIEFVHHLEENKDIEVFFGLNATLTQVDLNDYHSLKWVQLYMAGYDNVDVESIKSKGIMVSNARDIFSITIAEDVISKILYFNRNMKEFTENKKQKIWKPIWKDKEIWHASIGVIGTGSIGKEVAKRLRPFEPSTIMGYRTKNEPVEGFDQVLTGPSGLKTLIQTSDYIILAVPLTKETNHLMDQEKLSWMKKEALLVNVARGKVIDQDALIDVLENNQIRGAALDVTDPEPLPISSKLWTLENCYISPHNASSSEYMVERLYQLTLDNLSRYLNQEKIKYLL
jgi:phosphoglycerate dehydrogenase-like enzyme